MRKFWFLVFTFVFSSYFFCINFVFAEDLSTKKTPNYSAIVRVKSYTQGSNGFFVYSGAGSAGVIINKNGLILVSDEILVNRQELNKQAFQVCLPKTGGQEDCSLVASFIAESKADNLVLLKIISVPQNLPVVEVGKISKNDQANNLSVAHYQLDRTKGISKVVVGATKISGMTNTAWVSMTNLNNCFDSTRFIFNANSQLIAIAHHNQAISCLSGFAMDLSQISGWLNNSKDLDVSDSVSTDLLKFIKINKDINKSAVFSSDDLGLPSFSITKNSDWWFNLGETDRENVGINLTEPAVLSIAKTDLSKLNANIKMGDGGLAIIPYPRSVQVDYNNIDSFFESFIYPMTSGTLSAKVESKKDINSAELKGREYYVKLAGGYSLKFRVFASGNYFIVMTLNYGYTGQDKVAIDKMADSFLLKSEVFEELKNYSDSKNKFSIKSSNDWSIASNGRGSLLRIDSKKKMGFGVDLNYYSAPREYFTNKDFILSNGDLSSIGMSSSQELSKKIEASLSSSGDNISLSQEHFKLSNEIKNAVLIKTTISKNKKDEKASRSFSLAFKVRQGMTDGYLVFNGSFLGLQKDFDALFNSFVSYLGVNLQVDNLHEEALDSAYKIGSASSRYYISDLKMYKKLKGRIIIKAEDAGKAYYVSPDKQELYFLGRPEDAFRVMRGQGVGVKNTDLSKLLLGLNKAIGKDSDNDDLSDLLEDALGTDKNKPDTDSDGYTDTDEMLNGYNPLLVDEVLNIDSSFSTKQKGRILLQVEGKGEAWYVNQVDGRRYFLGRPTDAFGVMKSLGLGVSNQDFAKMIK